MICYILYIYIHYILFLYSIQIFTYVMLQFLAPLLGPFARFSGNPINPMDGGWVYQPPPFSGYLFSLNSFFFLIIVGSDVACRAFATVNDYV